MIIVNIKVPALEKEYNFTLEEKAPVGDLIEETVELISQKEGLTFGGEIEEMVLCSLEDGIQCDRQKSLSDYGICAGAELMLV